MALLPDGQEIFAYPQNNTAQPTPSTAGLSAGESVWNHYEWPASDHGDEVSQSPDFDFALPVTTITAYVQLPQYNFPTYQASTVSHSVFHCILICPRLSLWEPENITLPKIPGTTVTGSVCAPR